MGDTQTNGAAKTNTCCTKTKVPTAPQDNQGTWVMTHSGGGGPGITSSAN